MAAISVKLIVVVVAFGVVTSAVIGVSAYFAAQGDKSTEDENIPNSYHGQQQEDPDFHASVVLLRPSWSHELGDPASQAYKDIVTSAEYNVNKIFLSSSMASCFNYTRVANVTTRGRSVFVSLDLHFVCKNQTASGVMKAFDEGYAFLLVTKDNSRMATINSGTFEARPVPKLFPTTTIGTSPSFSTVTTVTTPTTTTPLPDPKCLDTVSSC